MKKMIAFLLVLFMIVPIASCAPSEEETADPSQTSAEDTAMDDTSGTDSTDTETPPGTDTDTGADTIDTAPEQTTAPDTDAPDTSGQDTKPPVSSGEDTSAPPVQTETPDVPDVKELNVIVNNKAQYGIVVENISDYIESVKTFKDDLKSSRNIVITYKTLREGTIRNEKEIIVGKTLDEIIAVVGADNVRKLSNLDFYIATHGYKVYLCSNTAKGAITGLQYLVDTYYKAAEKSMTLPGNTIKLIDATDIVLRPEETKIVIPGLKKTYKFLHFSDTHVILTDENMPQNRLTEAIARKKSFTTNNLSSDLRFPYFFKYAEKINADMILMSGDLIDNPTEANIKFLHDSVNASKIPAMYMIGNHDWCFSDDYWSDNAIINNIPRFKDLMGGDVSINVKEYDDLMIVSLDNSMDKFTEVQINTLTQLFKKGKPVIIMMHVPMTAPKLAEDLIAFRGRNFTIGTTGGAINRNEYTKKFEDLVYGADSPVVAIFAGHLHMGHTDVVGGKVTQYVTSPGYDNGGCRVYVVSGS